MIPKKIRNEILSRFASDSLYYKTQVYGYIKPRKNGEFTLTCYGVNITKTYGVRMTEVNRAWSDRPYYQCKNIWKSFFGGTRIVFNEKMQEPNSEGMWYNGKWGDKCKWEDCDSWFMEYITYLNLDSLQATKYKFCAYKQYVGRMSLMQYIFLYRKYREIEYLVKSGLSHFLIPSFLDKMKKNRELYCFFKSKIKEILNSKDGISAIDVIRAKCNGWSLEKAHEVETARRRCSWAPKGLDRVKLCRYLDTNNIDDWDYRHYLGFVKEARMDILGYGVAFPKDFHKSVIKMQKKVVEIRKREDKEREESLKKIAKKINNLLMKMSKKLEWLTSEYKVIIPTSRKQFEDEGRAMHSCIGGYFDLCADGKTACFFIRKNGKRHADVEMNIVNGSVNQCRKKDNKDADEKTKTFARAICKKILPVLRNKEEAA